MKHKATVKLKLRKDLDLIKNYHRAKNDKIKARERIFR